MNRELDCVGANKLLMIMLIKIIMPYKAYRSINYFSRNSKVVEKFTGNLSVNLNKYFNVFNAVIMSK